MNVINIDGKRYIIVDALEVNDDKYLVMGNESNPNDLMIRKVIVMNGEEYISKLDSEEELIKVLDTFKEKHRKDFKNE